MKPFYEHANENKDITELLDMRDAAELLRVSEMKDLIDCTIATVIWCPDSEPQIKEY